MNGYRPSPVLSRLPALLYEGVLLIGVTALAFIPAAIVAFLLRDWPTMRSALVGVVILLSWYAYFFSAWHKKEQTLAMQTWRIVLKTAQGERASPRQLNMRFVWASVFLLLLPMLVYLFARSHQHAPLTALGLAVIWWILPWGWALLHPKKQFLYDVLAGTMLCRALLEKGKTTS